MQSSALIAHIESTAPLHLAAPWDKSGVQIASAQNEINVMAVALDPTVETVEQALEQQAQFLLCHHPLTLGPRLPDRLDEYHQVLRLCLAHELWLYSAHTSLDANPAGPVNWLGRALGLAQLRVLEVTKHETPRLLRWHSQDAPGWTERVLWPEELAKMVRPDNLIYELSLDSPRRDYGFGCLGTLPKPLSWVDFSALLAPHLTQPPRLIGLIPDRIEKIAYCPGSGADLAAKAFAQGAQVFLTGDLKFHQAQDVQRLGLTMDVGHFCLEEAMMRAWSHNLTDQLAPLGAKVVFLPGHDPFTQS